MIQILLILAGVLLVTYGANILVSGATTLAQRMGVSDMVIGLTIVAFGTSAPELIVSITAAANGNAELAIGNVIGSNILNIGLILGITGLIRPLTIYRNTTWKEIPFALLGIMAVWLMASDTEFDQHPPSVLSRSDGLVLLCFFIIFFYYTLDIAKQNKEPLADAPSPGRSDALAIGLLIGGLIGLTLGGRLIVDNAVILARQFGVSESTIGLTLVAVGTSIPELATSITAALRGNTDIALGNVIGSNIFNSFLILGISATLAPIPAGGITQLDFLVCMGLTVLLFAMAAWSRKGRIKKTDAGILLAFYVIYTGWLLSTL